MKLQAKTMELTGTSYEIGQRLGQITAAVPPMRAAHTKGMDGFGEEQVKQAVRLFDQWCPGLTEELQGFADVLKVPLPQVFFYGMTYLLPRCSQIALSPAITRKGQPLVARNYEFSHEAEDFCLVKTAAQGRYTHMGTSVLHFGRDDGFNEHGLSVTMSSCGFPVGPFPYMRAPGIAGLQFWTVIRAVLENCKTVDEAVAYVKEMPIAFNINLMLVDKSGSIALVETLDGRKVVKGLEELGTPYFHTTNHAVFPELIAHEPQALRHSLSRYNWIQAQMEQARQVTADDLKSLLLSPFPEGPNCRFFNDFFGTTKSMVIDPACGTIELCWGGNAQNGWRQYNIDQPLADSVHEIEIEIEPFSPTLGEYVPLEPTGGA